jgi:hypothetical protein
MLKGEALERGRSINCRSCSVSAYSAQATVEEKNEAGREAESATAFAHPGSKGSHPSLRWNRGSRVDARLIASFIVPSVALGITHLARSATTTARAG